MDYREVKGFKGYEINRKGIVKSVDRVTIKSNGVALNLKGRVLKQTKDTHGYLFVNLSLNGKVTNIKTHKLMALTFLNHIPKKGIVIDHIDNNPLNNNIENLQIISHRENLSKDKKGGTSKYVGVSFIEKIKKYMASIQYGGKNYSLGTFNCETSAALTYQHKLKQI